MHERALGHCNAPTRCCGACNCTRTRAQVVLAGPNPKVLRVLERCGVLDEVGRHWVFSNVADAVDACVATPRLVVDGGSAVSDDKPGSSSSADLHIDYDTIRAGSKDVHSKER